MTLARQNLINGVLGGASRAVWSSTATVSTGCDSWSAQQYTDVSSQLIASLQSPLTWWAGLSGQTPIWVSNTGVSGQRIDQWYARLPALLADASKWLYWTTPQNSFGQAFGGYTAVGGPYAGQAITLTNVLAAVQAEMAGLIQATIRAGKTPIVLSCVGVSTWTATQLNIRNDYNTWLQAYCTATNSVFVDARTVLTDGNLSTATYKAGYEMPGGAAGHPSIIGSYFLGKALWQTAAFSIMSARNLLPISTASSQAFGTQILLNNLFQNTDSGGILTGGTNSGFTGDAPLSFTSSIGSGTISGVNSHTPAAVGNNLISTLTYGGTTTAETRFFQNPASGFPIVGQRLRGVVQYDVAANSVALNGIHTQASFTIGGVTTTAIDGYALVANAGPLPSEAFTYTALTPANLIVTSGTVTAVSWSTRGEYVGASGGSAVITQRQAALYVN